MKFNCNLCGSDSTRIIYPASLKSKTSQVDFACTNAGHGEYYQLVRCKNCGLYYSSPRPNSADLETAYSKQTDAMYQAELSGRIKTFSRNLVNLSGYKKSGSLLDVGSSMGVFIDLARKQGWLVAGIEPSRWAIIQAKKLFGLRIRQGTDRDLTKFGRKFDVVTMWDVLEHVNDPLVTLERCRKVLNPGGVLAFSTVDIGSVYARLMGKKWPWLMKMHIYYFDKNTIKKYLAKAGFKLIAIKKYRHTVSLNYLLYKLKEINLWLYLLTKLVKRLILLNQNIYITFGLGDFMEVYAKKI